MRRIVLRAPLFSFLIASIAVYLVLVVESSDCLLSMLRAQSPPSTPTQISPPPIPRSSPPAPTPPPFPLPPGSPCPTVTRASPDADGTPAQPPTATPKSGGKSAVGEMPTPTIVLMPETGRTTD
jgi:hypothetical protein